MEEWEKVFKQETEDPEFPDSYEIVNEIKSPLNVLWYNLNFEFIDKYPAKIPEDFVRDMIKLYSKKGDLVFDPMCGSGTVPRIANLLDRIGYGCDVNPKAIELAKKKDHPRRSSNYIVCDARELDNKLAKPQLILFSPPFGLNIIGDKNHYSDEPKDISHSKDYNQFFLNMREVFKQCYDKLTPGGILIFDSRDRTKDGTYYDMGVIFRNICERLGFKIICRYWYILIPYRQMTYKHKESGFVMPMVSAMDAYVMYKQMDEKLQ